MKRRTVLVDRYDIYSAIKELRTLSDDYLERFRDSNNTNYFLESRSISLKELADSLERQLNEQK